MQLQLNHDNNNNNKSKSLFSMYIYINHNNISFCPIERPQTKHSLKQQNKQQNIRNEIIYV